MGRLARYFGPVEVSRDSRKSGWIGWAGLILYIILYDLYAIRKRRVETLTRAFWRTSASAPGLVLTHLAWFAATLHLVVEFRARRAFHSKRSR